jgi:6-phosphogluconate dehydrogenase
VIIILDNLRIPTESLLMDSARLQSLTELQARIRQTVQDLEEHSRILPIAQQGTVEATIKRLKMALEGEEAIVSDSNEPFR